ncbi:thiolase domain-containing protein [Nocardioides islandensis]|uniref:Thiolase domain-containing protein n=1 Tax=Nocardioides islandensis TaxID=433663 RepID=A0A930VG96_9ACTN|nr:thiolase domain-containing protein [Nocardioides islandensis]MBF4764378.1 thiolase domain-containing protein [Nocardioides islandensis]
MLAPQLIGWAHTTFGRSAAPDVETLMADVAQQAMSDSGLEPSDIDAIHVGVYNHGFSTQSFEAALVGATTPALARVPAVRAENACATGSAALYGALDRIEAGRARAVLVIGAEKMTDTDATALNGILLGACHRKSEERFGSFAGVFSDLTDRYAARYGDPHDTMAMIAAKNHRNGVDNPWAHMRRDLGFDFCATASEKNPPVAGRLLRTDCSMVSDGAAAVVVTSDDVARGARRGVRIIGRHHANDHLAIADRRDPLELSAAAAAWHGALDEAGLSAGDLDLLETHDCFTIAELLQYEAFGIAEPGKAREVLEAGTTGPEGALPVNRSGGLKAKGHPLGATGVSQHIMAAMQLVGEAGDFQLRKADRAAVFNMGGAAVANYATILEGRR